MDQEDCAKMDQEDLYRGYKADCAAFSALRVRLDRQRAELVRREKVADAEKKLADLKAAPAPEVI